MEGGLEQCFFFEKEGGMFCLAFIHSFLNQISNAELLVLILSHEKLST